MLAILAIASPPHPLPVNPGKYRLTAFNPGVDFGEFGEAVAPELSNITM